jgi:hypothetical protein
LQITLHVGVAPEHCAWPFVVPEAGPGHTVLQPLQWLTSVSA